LKYYMKKRFNNQEQEELRNKIIGLGENSSKRTYYPELQSKLLQLERYKALLDNFIDGLIVVNATNGIVEDANRSALNMLAGLKVGKRIDSVLMSLNIYKEGEYAGVSKAISKGELESYSFNTDIMAGSEKKFLQFKLHTQEFGNIPYALIHVSDITEKEKSVQALKKSEANLHALIENTKDLIWSIDMDGRILSMNSAYKKVYETHFNCELNIGDDVFVHLPEDQLPLWKGRCERVLKGEYFSVEREVNEDGRMSFYNIMFSPIITEGVVTGAVIFLRDITERRKYELAIKENEEQLQKIIEGSPIGIVVSKKHKLDYANSAALSIFGYRDLSDIKGRSLIEFLAPNDRTNLEAMFANGLEGVYLTERLEVTGLSAEGSLIPLFVNMTGIELFDGLAFVMFFDDVSKQKEIERALIFAKTKAEESEKLKSEFLAQMSHEIRTPINTILSFSSLISDELHNIVSDDLKSSFDIMGNAGKRIIRTIDLILNMSEIQAGTYEVIFNKINLFSMVLNPLVNEYRPVASVKGIDLVINVSGDEDAEIFGDEYTVNEIFSNLIDNAIKYTEKGYVKIYGKQSEDESSYSIIVEDSGIGISKEYIPSLFNPFSQEERGYTRKYEGNGLGLALVKKYCELNNAEISVVSNKDIGSKFTVSFFKKRINKYKTE
jgi:PAS domain S-box-containing protein